MLSITEFSRLSQLPVRTLRHYHAKGVLVPHHVDEHTQYRWYGVDQVAVAAQISAMRRAGMSLAEVRGLLDDVDLVPEALRRHRDRLAAERAEQDTAVAELDDAAAERMLPTTRRRGVGIALTALGAWRRGDAENLTAAQAECEAVELRELLGNVAASRDLAVTERWWSALEVRGDEAAQRVGLPVSSRDGSPALRQHLSDLPSSVSAVRHHPAEEVVVALAPGAAEAVTHRALIAVLSFTADGCIADPRTLRYVDLGDDGAEFTAELVDDPRVGDGTEAVR